MPRATTGVMSGAAPGGTPPPTRDGPVIAGEALRVAAVLAEVDWMSNDPERLSKAEE
jgi:hypothetical protein